MSRKTEERIRMAPMTDDNEAGRKIDPKGFTVFGLTDYIMRGVDLRDLLTPLSAGK